MVPILGTPSIFQSNPSVRSPECPLLCRFESCTRVQISSFNPLVDGIGRHTIKNRWMYRLVAKPSARATEAD